MESLKTMFIKVEKITLFNFWLSQEPQNDTPGAFRANLGQDFAGRGSLRPPESGGGQDFAVRGSLRPPRIRPARPGQS